MYIERICPIFYKEIILYIILIVYKQNFAKAILL